MIIQRAKTKILSLLKLYSCLGVMLFLTATITGCNSTTDNDKKLNIVATTTMLHDLTEIIGGDNIDAIALMGVGIDPHLYKASAGDVDKMYNADVVVYNGIHLEGQMGEVFETLDKQNKSVICIEKGIDPSTIQYDPNSPDSKDPHIWFDVTIWMKAATYVSNSLSEIDPDNASEYQSNLDAYMTELENLHQYITDRVSEVSQTQRILITAHDAFNYFGNAYGFEVMGLQGISTETEAGTGDVRELAEFIAENKIKAIFVESSVPSKNIEALQDAVIALGFNVSIGGELYSDSLGDPSNGHDTYIATCRSNIDTIVDSLK